MGEKAAKDERGLTHRQRLFIEAYLGSGNGSLKASAIAAGYSERTAREKGYQVFHSPEVQAEIQRRYAEEGMAAGEVLRRLGEQARNRLSECIAFRQGGRKGGQAYLDLVRAKKLGLLHLVKKISTDKDGNQTVELLDPQWALERIGKHLGLFKESVDLTTGGLPLNVVAIEVMTSDAGGSTPTEPEP